MSKIAEPASPIPKKPSPIARFTAMIREDAWSTESLGDKSLRGRFYAAVRVIGITVKGVVLNKIPLNAAALTYYTLMSLGPMLALALTLSGAILLKQENGTALAKAKVAELIQMVAPQTASAGKPKESHPETGDTAAKPVAPVEKPATATVAPEAQPTKEEKAAATRAKAEELNNINPMLSQMVDNLIENSASGGASAVGTGILIILAVLMLTRVENAFNSIWGVTKGRPWKDRFVNYILFMVLGCVLGAASLTMLSVSSLMKSFKSGIPEWINTILNKTGSHDLVLKFLESSGPTIISIGLLALLVAVLIRFMPYTRVHWKAAFGGGLFVALALVGNQKLGALYATKVSQFDKLYGSMSIILVLMFGMYLSWLILLIGCQVTFAVQYVHRLAAYRTWESLSSRTRQTLCFGSLILIARRFRNMEIAADAEEMAAALHVPRSLVDEAIKRLLQLKLIVAIDDGDDKPENDRYRPDFPLNSLTVGKIRERLETFSGAVKLDPAFSFDRGLVRYTEAFGHFNELEHAKQSFDDLLAETEAKAS